MKRRLLRVAQFGLGPIGVETVRLASTKPWLRVIGAVDSDPAKAGRSLGQLAGVGSENIRVCSSLTELCRRDQPDLIFHTAVSQFAAAFEQLAPMARLGIDVVSSCEEMLFPQARAPKLARQLDALCQRSGARMVATGVNPGFVLDLLPLFLTSVCRSVRSLHVQRVVDASTRREPLQRKIGSGLSPAHARKLLPRGEIGHAGLRESLGLLVHGLGWRLGSVTEFREVVVARREIRTQFLSVEPGQVCGVHQLIEAKASGRIDVSFDLQMYLDAPHPHDAIQLEGDPPLNVVLAGGVAGDEATVAALVNTAPRLLGAAPGLRLLTDLTLPRMA